MLNLSSTMLSTTTQRNLSERESAKCTSTRVEMEKKKKKPQKSHYSSVFRFTAFKVWEGGRSAQAAAAHTAAPQLRHDLP